VFKSILKSTSIIVLAGLTSNAWSASITCGSTQRTATLSSAELCETGLGNAQASDILASYPSTPWTSRGELTGNGSNSYLTVNLTSGSWGSSPIAATWAIDASFWDTYAEAVLSIHVGNGNGDPDYFAWLITPDETSGIWSYADLDQRGGGLSNMKLWSRGQALPDPGPGPTPVPAPATLAIFGLGLLSLSLSRKKLS